MEIRASSLTPTDGDGEGRGILLNVKIISLIFLSLPPLMPSWMAAHLSTSAVMLRV